MTTFSDRLLRSVVDVRSHERATIVLMFAYSFLAMTSYNIIKPATRSSFIVELGAENLPFVMLAAGVLMGGVMDAYSRLVNLIPSRWVIPGTQAAIIGVSVGFWFLLRTGEAWVSAAFFFWGLLLGIFLISQFWTLANDLFDARQAKRLFGFIGGGASLGGMTGAATTALTAGRFGTDNLVLVSTVPLVACFVVAWYVSSHAKVAPGLGSESSAERIREREALSLLRESKHLRLIAGVIGFAAMSAVTLDQQLSMAAEELVVEEDAITTFLAQVTVYISLIGFFIQVGLTSRVHRHLGIGFALMVLPVSLGITGVVMLLFPVLWAPALARVLNSSLRYTLDKTSREILFLPLSPELKHRAKPFVDVAVDRFMGKGLGSVVLLVLLKLFNLTWYQLSYASLTLMVLWIVLARRARQEYLTVFRQTLHTRQLTANQIQVPEADLATIGLLVEELGRPEEDRVLHAISLLKNLDRNQYVMPLLLRHHSPKVRARALEVLSQRPLEVAGRWEETVEQLLRDEHPEVRTAAVETLAWLRQVDVAEAMRPYLADRDPRVVAAAAIAVGSSDQPDDVEMARAAIEQLAEGGPAVRRTALKETARALARVPGPRSEAHLIHLLHDPDWEVVLEAVRHVPAEHDPDQRFVPELVRLLPDRRVRHAARRELARYGEPVVERLESLLSDRTEAQRVRWQLASTLPLIPCQASVEALMNVLDDPDAMMRYYAALALGKLRRLQDGLHFDSDLVEEAAIRTTQRYVTRLDELGCLNQAPLPNASLLGRAVLEDVRRKQEHLFELISLIYPWRDIQAARWAIETGDQAHRASAAEYLDNVLTGRLRQHVMPVLDRLLSDAADPLDTESRSTDRDLEAVLSRLILDDQPVIAVCAIGAVGDLGLSELACTLERVCGVPDRDPSVVESVARVLDKLATAPVTVPSETDVALEVVQRLAAAPPLGFVPVRELFRLAEPLEHVRYRAGQGLFEEGDPASRLHLIRDGEVVLLQGGVEASRVGPGHVVGLEEVLAGRPMRQTARAHSASVCLSGETERFLAVLSDHAKATEGLFRYYLDRDSQRLGPIVRGTTASPNVPVPLFEIKEGQPLSLAQKALLLEQTPVFAPATGEALFAMAHVAVEVSLGEGTTLCGRADAPSIYLPVSAELSVELPEQAAPATVAQGDMLGVVPTLTGRPMGVDTRVTRPGVALHVQREDLFEFLGEHLDLFHGVFAVVLGAVSGAPITAPARAQQASSRSSHV